MRLVPLPRRHTCGEILSPPVGYYWTLPPSPPPLPSLTFQPFTQLPTATGHLVPFLLPPLLLLTPPRFHSAASREGLPTFSASEPPQLKSTQKKAALPISQAVLTMGSEESLRLIRESCVRSPFALFFPTATLFFQFLGKPFSLL